MSAEEPKTNEAQEQTRSGRSRRKWWIAAAACLLVFGVYLFQIRPHSHVAKEGSKPHAPGMPVVAVAAKTARKTVELTINQYKSGTVSYLNVLVAQTAELNNEKTAADILSRRMTAGVVLIKALGGGWNALALH